MRALTLANSRSYVDEAQKSARLASSILPMAKSIGRRHPPQLSTTTKFGKQLGAMAAVSADKRRLRARRERFDRRRRSSGAASQHTICAVGRRPPTLNRCDGDVSSATTRLAWQRVLCDANEHFGARAVAPQLLNNHKDGDLLVLKAPTLMRANRAHSVKQALGARRQRRESSSELRVKLRVALKDGKSRSTARSNRQLASKTHNRRTFSARLQSTARNKTTRKVCDSKRQKLGEHERDDGEQSGGRVDRARARTLVAAISLIVDVGRRTAQPNATTVATSNWPR